MGTRTWLVSDSPLNPHLLIQSHIRGQPLRLVSLRRNIPARDLEHIREQLATDPMFAKQNRQRLENALSIGTVRFVIEWLSSAPDACRHVAVWGLPDLWTTCGYRAVPEGLIFGGVPAEEPPDLKTLEEENCALVDTLATLLPKQNSGTGPVASLSETIRIKAGLAANELSVMLEDKGDFEAAYRGYSRATRIDPMNISAALNAYALVTAQRIHPERADALCNRLRQMLSDRNRTVQGLNAMLQTYGTIRQQAVYRQQAALWASWGSREMAIEKNRQALALSKQTGMAAILENAHFYADADNPSQAETCYRAVLAQDDANASALVGLAMLTLSQHQSDDAEKWILRARQAGASSEDLRDATIRLALQKGETENALGLITDAIRKKPDDLRYRALEAEVLLKKGDLARVEREVLPSMQALKRTPYAYLTHAVRGCLLKKKGASYYHEARKAFNEALSLNPAQPNLWNDVLALDLAIGDLKAIRTDAQRVLLMTPRHALANYLLGSLLMKNGALAESEDYLRRSVESHPTVSACNDLGENLRRQKRLPEAETFARQALKLDTTRADVLDTLATILFDSGRYAAAAEYAAQAVAAQPRDMTFQLTLLRIQLEQGDQAGVQERLRAFQESGTRLPESLAKRIAIQK